MFGVLVFIAVGMNEYPNYITRRLFFFFSVLGFVESALEGLEGKFAMDHCHEI